MVYAEDATSQLSKTRVEYVIDAYIDASLNFVPTGRTDLSLVHVMVWR